MGGNALKNTVTRRYQADEYHALEAAVLIKLRTAYPGARVMPLQAYRLKESFGDMDVLIDTPVPRQDVVRLFSPNEIVKNGDVFSFDVQEFQVDLIRHKPENFDTAYNYYAWNDLGNLMGRVAHKLGFKFGHEGLVAAFRDNNYLYAHYVVSKDTTQILKFLGYDPERFFRGFDTLDEMYAFAASTSFFNKDIFAFENRNHTARVRDAKRASYNGFLAWLETQTDLPEYLWPSTSELGGIREKKEFTERAFTFFPGFEQAYSSIQEDHELWKKAKELFNGNVVSELTGLSGKELGGFMTHLKNRCPSNVSFPEWLLGKDDVKVWMASEFAAL